MKRQSCRRSDNNQPIAFARKHRFKDTLALFIVFLSFNHFASLCLLVSFVIATRFRNFLANSFITLFLSKKPSPPMNEVSHAEYDTDAQFLMSSSDKKYSMQSNRKSRSNLSLPLLLVEMIIATILKLYGENYFINPIENLALSILASSMINDPSDCLSYATSCSVMYAVMLQVYQRLGVLQQMNDGFTQLCRASFPVFTTGLSLGKTVTFKNQMLSTQVLKWIDKYVQHLLYYISFHIVIFQFSQSTLSPSYSDDKLKNTKRTTSKNDTPRSTGQRISSTSSTKGPSDTANLNIHLQNSFGSNADKTNQSSLGAPWLHESSSISSQGISGMNTANLTSSSSKKSSDRHRSMPYFTGVVSQFEVFEPSLTSAAGSNSQAVTTNVTLSSPSSVRGSDREKSEEVYSNQFYEIKVDFKNSGETRNLKLDVSVTTNLENFIRHLFKRKNQHLIPPLWSIVVTLKTTNFERKCLRETKEVSLTPSISGTGSENEGSEGSITPTNSNNSISDGQVAESVFNKLQASGTMALIAQTAFDDYAQLHLVSTKDNIFKKDDKDYKVCIVEIASNSITFHIENLHEGELIVLVNGVIWSEVSCALILEHEGEELVVVGGLVPACSYDIQFINRLSQTEDFLISDLMVRTVGNQQIAKKFENIDLSFPSYYHRKFLSPLLTLKHSVLTTNTNLAEGRAKLKKSKKEVSKKLNTLRQDIDHLKSKISQNASNDEKSASKVESLKVALQQSEGTLYKLEETLKELSDKEIILEEEYLKQKDLHLRRQMDYSKLEDSLDGELKTARNKSTKLQQELNQMRTKKEKLFAKQEKLQKEVDQNAEELEAFKNQFLSRREKDRYKRQELRTRELNEFEMKVKGLEQDISRLEGENGNLQKMTSSF